MASPTTIVFLPFIFLASSYRYARTSIFIYKVFVLAFLYIWN
jgi:hypothetical protein